MGRSMPTMAGACGASQMASRSYVFGRDDSNSAAAPIDGSNAQVRPLFSCCCHAHHLASYLIGAWSVKTVDHDLLFDCEKGRLCLTMSMHLMGEASCGANSSVWA